MSERKPRGGRRMTAGEIAVISALGAGVGVTLILIVVTLNRGFDWTDEAFVYMMLTTNRAAVGEFWGFQHLLSPLFDATGGSVLVFRVFRLLGYLAVSAVLLLIGSRILRLLEIRLRRSGVIIAILTAQIGTFLAWSYPPRYLGYNETSTWVAQIGGALLILLLLRGRSRLPFARLDWILWAVIGLSISVLYMAKITSAIAFGVVALGVAIISALPRAPWSRVLATLGGAAVGLVLLLLVGVPLGAYSAQLVSLLLDPSAQVASGYSVTALLQTYVQSAASTLSVLGIPLLLAVVVLLVAHRGGRGSGGRLDRSGARTLEQLALVLALVLALSLLLPRPIRTWDDLGVQVGFLLVVGAVGAAVIGFASPPELGLDRPRLVVSTAVLLFVITPFFSGLGTNNPIFGQLSFSGTFWAVAAGLVLAVLWQRSRSGSRLLRFVPVLLAVVVTASASISVAGDVFVHPYNGADPYFSQKTTTQIPALRGVLVSEREAERADWLHELARSEGAEGVPATSIGAPGALLAFNASGWTNPWIGPYSYPSVGRSCAEAPVDDLFVLQPEDRQEGELAYDGMVAGLGLCDLTFPDDFELVDRYDDPLPDGDVLVWRLR